MSASTRSPRSARCAPSSRQQTSALLIRRAPRQLVEGGYAPRYDYGLQALREIPYDRWREYDPEDTVRFYALRLREVGFIKSLRKRSLPKTPTGVF